MFTFDYEGNALSDITNFIAQEIYLLAVRHTYPSQCEHIKQLAKQIKNELLFVKDEFNDEPAYEEIVAIVINSILTDVNEESLQEELIYCLNNRHSFYVDDEDHIIYLERMKQKIASCVSIFFKEFNGASLKIPHQYPPYLLTLEHDLISALVYFYNKEYLPKIKDTKEMREICTTSAPYEIIRRYGFSRYRTRLIQHEVEVPTITLKKRMKNSKVIEVSNEKDSFVQEYFNLAALSDVDSVSYTDELRISIDTSSPLDDLEVDKILAMIRCELSSLQRNNKHSEYRLAIGRDDLRRAARIPDITTEDYVTIKKLHASQIQELNTALNAKNYLCGLIILYRSKFEPENDNSSLEQLCYGLSEELINSVMIDRSKFSPDTIARGYKKVKKLFDNQIKMLMEQDAALTKR